MEGWILFWKILLIVVVIIFAAISVKVTIGGFFDVKALFKDIDEQHNEDDET